MPFNHVLLFRQGAPHTVFRKSSPPVIKHPDCPVEGPLTKQLFSDTCQSTVKQISLRRPTEVGVATTAMEFSTEGERLVSIMNTIRERWGVIATEHSGGQWMENYKEEILGVRRDSG